MASFFALQMLMSLIQPQQLLALTGGPAQPEFNAFTPIGTSNLVDLSSGDFNYNIPILDVGGYPLNLAYDSGVTMDQEASWVGLGWNLNVGQIARQVRGLPDDFNGDLMNYENDMRENVTVGSNFGVQGSIFGLPTGSGLSLSLGLGVQYNNYEGITFKPSYGVSFAISDNVQVGMNISSSTADGASVSPSVSFSSTRDVGKTKDVKLSNSIGLSMSSRKGLESLSLSSSMSHKKDYVRKDKDGNDVTKSGSSGAGASGSISFNDNHLYTPQKRAGTVSGNFSFNAALGSEILGVEVQGHIQGFGSYQKIRNSERNKNIPSYGYDFTEYADKGNSILDFTREKDRSFNKNTTVLPIANHTYDIYSIKGHGIGGMFRPHRGQVSYLMDNKVSDFGDGVSAGAEFGVGWNVHGGVDIKISPSYSYTGGWEDGNFALNRFAESDSDVNDLSYENVYYKMVGELNADPESNLYNDKLQANKALKLDLGGSRYNRQLLPNFKVKNSATNYSNQAITSKIKRSERNKRNSAIYTINKSDAQFDPQIAYRGDNRIKPHHTAGIKIWQPDGKTYVYGQSAYNWNKEEITVDLSGASGADCISGTINYGGGVNSSANSDQYKNIIRTPAYAHSYLLSSILSTDYEDLTNNGPSLDDLGNYTIFNYGNNSGGNHYLSNYHWRTPYQTNKANYNEGLKSNPRDQKGSVISGTKELRYVRTIATKTHVAYFKLSDRKDAREAGGANRHMKKIDNIFLYSITEYDSLVTNAAAMGETLEDLTVSELEKTAIKTTHFEYDYALCPGTLNNPPGGTLTANESADQGGKLTLQKVFFTYRGSNMGRYTPYRFHYDSPNPTYSLKGYDIWGNYKSNAGPGCGIDAPLTTSEYPFVEQNQNTANYNTSAWVLTSVDMPSGGKMEFETESDDYQFVQDRKAMQMYKIRGFGGSNPLATSDRLYNGGSHNDHIHVKISEEAMSAYSGADFLADYLSENVNNPIYFRALLNMVKNSNTQYDYVSGYFKIEPGSDGIIDGNDFQIATDANGTYVSIPMQLLDREGGFINQGDDNTNPIAKAGWYFGRQNLNRIVYSLGGNGSNTNFVSIVEDLVSSLGAVFEIFSGPNTKLQEKQCARFIKANKSWVRLENTMGRKLGGGLRVTKIEMHDQWDLMDLRSSNDGDDRYRQQYGQEYSYDLEDGTSSGVATYEPNGSKENPLIQPFYDNAGNGADKLVASKESNYAEKPFGESFFPSPAVTYSRVEVKNLDRQNGDQVVRQNATGKVVNEFYTSRDFPTLTDYTDITPRFDPPGPLSSIFNLNVVNHLSFSQGFVVETNDINGREKSVRVFPEGQDAPISGKDYIYHTDDEGQLSSTVTTVDKEGMVSEAEVGLDYDVYSDFRENYSEATTAGVDFNVAGFVIFIFPVIVPLPIPDYAYHETKLRTSSLTKVVHRSAILKETIAYDVGASISTKNVAWDAHTGQVMLAETVNEYDDHYYSFNYPSHWHYDGMDMAIQNIGINGVLSKAEDAHQYQLSNGNPQHVFEPGDELLARHRDGGTEKVWVGSVGNSDVVLMNRMGGLLNDACPTDTIDFTIIRSGFRNQQGLPMAGVTSMRSPIDLDGDGNSTNNITSSTFEFTNSQQANPRVIDANAIEYRDAWTMQWENNWPPFPGALSSTFDQISYGGGLTVDIPPQDYGFNPYLYNVRGNWKTRRSHAYLTSRVSHLTGASSPRYEGFYQDFSPFYFRDANSGNWKIDTTDWTSTSMVTKFSPIGAELENRDALGRYSSAQYGYQYTLPVAIASNSEYREMGSDNFEDYFYQSNTPADDGHFSFYDPADPNTSLTRNTAHSGHSSIAVTGSTSLVRDYTNYCDYEVDYEGPDCSDPVDPIECTPFQIPIGMCGNNIGCSTGYDPSSVWLTGPSGGGTPVWDNIVLDLTGSTIEVNYICNPTCPPPTGSVVDVFVVHFFIGGQQYFVEVTVNNSNC